jgi:flagellar basal body-associated protein FliL
MADQEEEAHRSRVVVETPAAERQVVHDEAVRYPERNGVSGAVLAAVVILVVALAAIIILFVMNRQQQDTTNANLASQPPQTTIVQQPAQQPPVVVEQPAPVIVNNPIATGGSTTANAPDDSSIQAAVDRKLSNDPNLSSLGVYATVANGKATLTGTVKTEGQKAQVERAVRNVKGVKSVDNQIIVG